MSEVNLRRQLRSPGGLRLKATSPGGNDDFLAVSDRMFAHPRTGGGSIGDFGGNKTVSGMGGDVYAQVPVGRLALHDLLALGQTCGCPDFWVHSRDGQRHCLRELQTWESWPRLANQRLRRRNDSGVCHRYQCQPRSNYFFQDKNGRQVLLNWHLPAGLLRGDGRTSRSFGYAFRDTSSNAARLPNQRSHQSV